MRVEGRGLRKLSLGFRVWYSGFRALYLASTELHLELFAQLQRLPTPHKDTQTSAKSRYMWILSTSDKKSTEWLQEPAIGSQNEYQITLEGPCVASRCQPRYAVKRCSQLLSDFESWTRAPLPDMYGDVFFSFFTPFKGPRRSSSLHLSDRRIVWRFVDMKTPKTSVPCLNVMDSGLVGSTGGVPREQEMLNEDLSRVIYHQVH